MTREKAESKTGRCPLCGDDRTRLVFVGKDLLHGLGEGFSYVECVSCGLRRQDPVLSAKEVEKYYPSDYSPHLSFEPVPPIPIEKTSHKLRRIRMKWIISNRPSLLSRPPTEAIYILLSRIFSLTAAYRFNPFTFRVNGRKSLDVGCGDGRFLAEQTVLGWAPIGYEVNDAAAKRARSFGFEVRTGDFSELSGSSELTEAFDLVTMRQSIEHFQNPVQALATAFRLIKPGGFLGVWTPVRDGLIPRLFKKYWYNLDLPRHQFLFHQKGLVSAAKQAGFTVLETAQLSSTRSVTGSLGYWLKDRLGIKWKKSSVSYRMIELMSRPIIKILDLLGFGDNLMLIACKGEPDISITDTETE